MAGHHEKQHLERFTVLWVKQDIKFFRKGETVIADNIYQSWRDTDANRLSIRPITKLEIDGKCELDHDEKLRRFRSVSEDFLSATPVDFDGIPPTSNDDFKFGTVWWVKRKTKFLAAGERVIVRYDEESHTKCTTKVVRWFHVYNPTYRVWFCNLSHAPIV